MGDLFPAAGVEGRERLGSRNAFDHRDLPGHLASVHKGDIPPAFEPRRFKGCSFPRTEQSPAGVSGWHWGPFALPGALQKAPTCSAQQPALGDQLTEP